MKTALGVGELLPAGALGRIVLALVLAGSLAGRPAGTGRASFIVLEAEHP